MNPTIIRPICGTDAGYRAHTKRVEERCQPCKTAWTERCKKYTHRTKMTAQEIAEEIEWLLSLNQGEHYILRAIGYQGRERSLEARLRDHGLQDVARRLLFPDLDAAA